MHRPPVTQRSPGNRQFDYAHPHVKALLPHGREERARPLKTSVKVKAIESAEKIRVSERENERAIERWIHSRSNVPAGARALMYELLKISKDIKFISKDRYVSQKRVMRLKLTTHCLGQFVRHYFGSDISLRLFAEWMFDCPVFHSGDITAVNKRVRGKDFDSLEHNEQKYYRYLMREILRHLFKLLLEKEYNRKCLLASDDRVVLFIKNERTKQSFGIVVDMETHTAVASYPKEEINKRMRDRSARKRDHYLNRPNGRRYN